MTRIFSILNYQQIVCRYNRFMETMRAGPPRATLTLAAFCVAVYLGQVAAGANWWDAGADDLLRLGALYAPAIALGEVWRAPASLVLHGSLLHLLVNLLALFDIGRRVESALGGARLLLAFLAAGLAGALASALAHPDAIAVGASGGIFGLFALDLADAWRVGARTSALRLAAVAVYAAVALGAGFLVAGVDNAAHLAGFASGALIALALRQRRGAAASTALAIAGLAFAGQFFIPDDGVARYREDMRFDVLYRQFAAADREINRELRAIGTAARQREIGDAEALVRIDRAADRLAANAALWERERFVSVPQERARQLWIRYTQLRIDAIAALRTSLLSADAEVDAAALARFEANMREAAALVESVRR
jgi:rhomboid protease GluP